MPKLPRVRATEVIAALERLGLKNLQRIFKGLISFNCDRSVKLVIAFFERLIVRSLLV
jgi:hypothetical protein